MTSREIKRKVKEFCKEFQIQELTPAALCKAMERQGYTVVAFHHLDNEEPVSSLIEALHLSDLVDRSKGFTYADRDFRAVFVHEELSEREKLMVLAHEEGHIFCGHLASVPVLGKDVQEEFEANEFAHYLLHQADVRRAVLRPKDRKKALLAGFLALLAVCAVLAYFIFKPSDRPVYADYYVTETGFKYHKKECIFVKGKDNARPITEEEYNSGDYSPCSVCMPED